MSHSNQQKISISGLCGALGAVALAGAASISQAHPDYGNSDWKGYAGVNCLPQSKADPIRRTANRQTAFANTGTSTITVFCPVVRDVAEGGDNRVTAVALRFNNRNSEVNGRCEFSSHDIAGIRIDSRSAVAPFGEHVLQLGPVNAHNWGSYVISCQVPGRDRTSNLQSYIINYRVEEELP